MDFDCYKISNLNPKKHTQKNKTLILTFSKPFQWVTEDFMLKMQLYYFVKE